MRILLTGGASGLGEAITRKLAADHEVYFTYNNSSEKAKELEHLSPNIHSIKCNFSDKEELQLLLNAMGNIEIEVLINNAWSGILQKHFHSLGKDEIEQDFAINLLPTLQITQQAIKIFRKQKFGKIITILSSAIVGNAPVGWSSYAAGKSYLFSMAKSWAIENAKYNITSNCVSPDFMRTNLTQYTDPRVIEEMINNHPLKKLLTTGEVSDTVAYLVAASPQINGINLIINHAAHVV